MYIVLDPEEIDDLTPVRGLPDLLGNVKPHQKRGGK